MSEWNGPGLTTRPTTRQEMRRYREKEYVSCLRKTKYWTRFDAHLAALQKEAAEGVELRLYKCDHCTAYHLCKRQNWRGGGLFRPSGNSNEGGANVTA